MISPVEDFRDDAGEIGLHEYPVLPPPEAPAAWPRFQKDTPRRIGILIIDKTVVRQVDLNFGHVFP